MKNALGIVGASGHGKVIADIARQVGYEQIYFFDDNKSVRSCGRYPVIGATNQIIDHSCDIIIGIGNAAIRERIQKKIEASGGAMVTLIHPSAVIGEDVTLGAGSVVMAGAVINPGCKLGKGCIVNTCSSVDHDCILEDYVHIAIGAHVAGTVHIGNNTWVGAGATIINNINICADCMIGAGAVVCKSIIEEGIYIGVPAKKY